MKRRATGAGVTKRPKKKSRSSSNQVVMVRPVMGGNRLPANLRSFGGEVKAVDVPSGNVTLNSTGSITCLNLISAGASFFNRIGRRIEMKNLTLSAQIKPLRAATGVDYVRVMIVYDRQTNGANPNLADVLQTTDQTGANVTSSYSGINLNNRDRFRIFVDERITLGPVDIGIAAGGLSAYVDPIKTTYNIKRFVKLQKELTQFKADSAPAVIGDIATGGLFLVTVGQLAAGTEGYRMQVETRVRFNDV